jgi:hypothetical protein
MNDLLVDFKELCRTLRPIEIPPHPGQTGAAYAFPQFGVVQQQQEAIRNLRRIAGIAEEAGFSVHDRLLSAARPASNDRPANGIRLNENHAKGFDISGCISLVDHAKNVCGPVVIAKLIVRYVAGEDDSARKPQSICVFVQMVSFGTVSDYQIAERWKLAQDLRKAAQDGLMTLLFYEAANSKQHGAIAQQIPRSNPFAPLSRLKDLKIHARCDHRDPFV